MATLSEMVKVIAAVQGLDENQVLWIARYLREDGLIAQGGRGRGGAQMGPADAANLLIGVNAPGAAKQSTQLVRSFRNLPLVRDDTAPENVEEWDGLKSEGDDDWARSFYRLAPFGNALEQVIKQFCKSDVAGGEDITRISLSGPVLTASIYMGVAEPERAGDISISVAFTNASDEDLANEMPDQEISKAFTERTLTALGQLLKM